MAARTKTLNEVFRGTQTMKRKSENEERSSQFALYGISVFISHPVHSHNTPRHHRNMQEDLQASAGGSRKVGIDIDENDGEA